MGHFFQGRATERLLDSGIAPGLLNEDRMGRTLDTLYGAGGTSVFLEVKKGGAGLLLFPVSRRGSVRGLQRPQLRPRVGVRTLCDWPKKVQNS